MVRSNQRDRSGNESSGDEGEGQIRVGKEYQINPPDFIPLESKFFFEENSWVMTLHKKLMFCFITERRADQCPERALLVWSPCPTISNAKCKF